MELHHELAGVSSSPETKNLYRALAQAQKTYTPIRRSGENKNEGFRYATYRDICDATLPSLLQNGFAQPTFCTGYDRARSQWLMVGTLNHESGEWISSVCPLLLGYPEGASPGIQALEIDCTYARKILAQGLAGGWLEAEGLEAPPPVAEKPEAPPVVKQEAKKREQSDGELIISRADAALTAKKGDEAQVKKIWEHLEGYAQDGVVTQSQLLELRAKHTFDAKVVAVTETPDAKKGGRRAK